MTASLPDAQPVPAGPRVAELQLRGRAGPLRTRVHWPPGTGGPVVRPLLVVLPTTGADVWWATVSARSGVVVLAVTDTRVTRMADELALAEATTALQWAADHADELHADPARLLVGGEGTGAWLAAAMALEARDDGWPSVVRQVLVVTATSDNAVGAARSVPRLQAPSLAGVAPAIVVTIGEGPHAVDARRYASRLRGAGIPVDELHHDGPVVGVADRLAPTLRRDLGGIERAAGMTAAATTATALGPPASAGRRRVAGRDPGDLARRLEEHRVELTAFCAVRLRSRSEAEDAAQETLIRAWRSYDRFRGASSLRTWLYRIAGNVCIDALRSPQRRALPLDLGAAPGSETAAGSPRPSVRGSRRSARLGFRPCLA